MFSRKLAEDKTEHIPELLAQRAASLVQADEFYRARVFLEFAGRWYDRLGRSDRMADMTLARALSLELEADMRMRGDASSAMVAGSFLEEAIQTFRLIPREHRTARGVDDHLERIHPRISEMGLKALEAMVPISAGPIDISEYVRYSEELVAGKELPVAMLALANVHSGVRFRRLKDNAARLMQESSIRALMGSTHVGRDGRVVAKTPAAGRSGGDSPGDDLALWSTIMREYRWEVDLLCKAHILPAARTVTREHRLRKEDLAHVLRISAIVPTDRVEQFAKGLWEGFDGDFSTAMHVLAPQVENLVRWHLKRVGAKTTTFDKEGIENEVGLSALLENHQSKVQEIFGEDIAFELEALFCNPLGGNLRNEVAHGMLADHECNTADAVYAWWLVLRIAYNSFWNRTHPQPEESPDDPQEQGPADSA